VSISITLSIPAISCSRCVATVERVTKDLPGVLSVHGDPDSKTAAYVLEGESALPQFKKSLAEAGFPVAA
jgi:copper chaperone CopZ